MLGLLYHWTEQYGPPSVLLITTAIALIGDADILGQFGQFGLLGLVLGWLMWRVEQRLNEIKTAHEDARDAWQKVGKAIVLLALSNHGEDGVRQQADSLLRELGEK